VIDLSSVPSVCPHMCIVAKQLIGSGLLFGVVSWVGLGMGVLDFGDDRRRGRGSLGVNLRRPIITSMEFVASLCGSA